MNVFVFCVLVAAVASNAIRIICDRGTFLTDNSFCAKCPEHCEACNSTNRCFDCKTGYTGKVCQDECSNCLLGTACEINNGYCLTNCRSGLSGELCDTKCNSKCMTCDRLNANMCWSCAADMYGLRCNETCSIGCLHNTCSDLSGECTYGCSVGYWGQFCEQNCSTKCKDAICDANTGECLNGCLDGYNGTNCTISTSIMETNLGNSDSEIILDIHIVMIVGLAIILIEAIAIFGTCIKMKRIHSQFKRSTNPPANIGTSSRISEGSTNPPANIGPSSRISEEFPLMSCGDEKSYIKPDFTRKTVYVDKLTSYVQNKTNIEYIEEFEKLPNGLVKPFAESQKKENVSKNKCIVIYPYDESRVILRGRNSDYINASFIDGYKESRAYIATSDPPVKNKNDVSSFWRMVWQQNCGIIVMLSTARECQDNKDYQYWPDCGATALFDGICVTCLDENISTFHTIRTLKIQMDSQQRITKHLHYTAWSETEEKEDVTNIVEFRQAVNKYKNEVRGPTVVHCSDGVGRTGTYIALDILTKKADAEGQIDIFATVTRLREQRVKMVHNIEQYIYLHRALVTSLTWYTPLDDM